MKQHKIIQIKAKNKRAKDCIRIQTEDFDDNKSTKPKHSTTNHQKFRRSVETNDEEDAQVNGGYF